MRKYFYIILFVSFMSVFSCAFSFAEDHADFIKNNPDGQKYDFIRTYLTALNYLYMNETRQSKRDFTNIQGTSKEKNDQYFRELMRDNINIRTSRNLMKPYFSAGNPLMVKATDIFYQVCDEQAKLNDEEMELIKKETPVKTKIDPNHLPEKNDSVQAPLDEYIVLNNRRKESLQKLLEASLLAAKVLISNKTDQEGDLVVLGINKEERKKLLLKTDIFRGSGYEGEMREGQSFLEASVASIRDVLKDPSWGTLEDLKN